MIVNYIPACLSPSAVHASSQSRSPSRLHPHHRHSLAQKVAGSYQNALTTARSVTPPEEIYSQRLVTLVLFRFFATST